MISGSISLYQSHLWLSCCPFSLIWTPVFKLHPFLPLAARLSWSYLQSSSGFSASEMTSEPLPVQPSPACPRPVRHASAQPSPVQPLLLIRTCGHIDNLSIWLSAICYFKPPDNRLGVFSPHAKTSACWQISTFSTTFFEIFPPHSWMMQNDLCTNIFMHMCWQKTNASSNYLVICSAILKHLKPDMLKWKFNQYSVVFKFVPTFVFHHILFEGGFCMSGKCRGCYEIWIVRFREEKH